MSYPHPDLEATTDAEFQAGSAPGVAAVAVVAFVGFVWLGGLLAKVSPSATALLMRLGGLLLATIGVQMLLGGLKSFFAA